MKWFLLLPAVLAATVLGSGDAPAQAPSDGGKLVRVVLLSRHGVRSPTQNAETLASWRRTAISAWPDFGVPPGYLTPKGEDRVDEMGGFYRTYLDPEGLFRDDRCPDDVFIWADRDERTVLTAQGLGSGLTRGGNPAQRCRFAIDEAADKTDPVFHPTVALPACHLDADKVKRSVNIGELLRTYGKELNLVQHILQCCSDKLCRDPGNGAAQTCSLLTLPSSVDTAKGRASIKGGLGIAQSFAETLLLQYAQGFGYDNFGFGRARKASMLETLRLHTGVFDAVQRVPYVAQRQGANMLYHLAYAVENGRDPGATGGYDKFIAYVGHDTNIANVAALLNLHWTLPAYGPDEKDDMPPGGALIFEVRQAANQEPSVSAFFAAQSPDDMRLPRKPGITRPPPPMAQVGINGCGRADGSCSMTAFVGLAKHALDYDANKDCITEWRWSSPPKP